jgi:hypothetical protein
MGTEHLRHQFNHLFDNISIGDIKGFVFQHDSFISAAIDLSDWFICWDLKVEQPCQAGCLCNPN